MYNISNTLFFGKVLLTLDEVGSTNSYAKSLLSKSTPIDGTAILAHDQQAGRGQIGNTWDSAPGKNITLSLVLYPKFLAAKQQFKLNQAISLGIRDFLMAYMNEVYIKWPNDIYCKDKKVAGILIENQLKGNSLESTVVGIGLNVNQTEFNELTHATSLKIITGKEHDIMLLLEPLLAAIERYYLLLREGDFTPITEGYHKAMYNLGIEKQYETANGQFAGTISGVNDIGQLIIETSQGTKIFNHQKVRLLD